ncbi:NADH-quinone oxidoreductase subunit L [Rhizosaccharibacter radicis]|uniref:NADH-quinone oxidoreductase subunit L n=1 Tax=Rhizosaccharibacter radicis TaxID=2782605 RepID=A0ABT1VYK1_9PROT|nr:NADH-quinone oxidoreductase subunit L [Acetobacteraceae bacterium KSS12]
MITVASLFSVAVFAPLLGALVTGLLGRVIGDPISRIVSVGLMVVSAGCAVAALWFGLAASAQAVAVPVSTWVQAGGFHAAWTLRFDTLSASMVTMVSCVSMLIHLYSVGYMSHEKNPVHRFFAYLSLFTFAMLMLVTSDNLIQLFFGWEGVGLASYLLIGYWYDRPSAVAAAIKAFIVNRIADLFFMVGIALLFLLFGTVSYDNIFATVPEHVGASYRLFGTSFPAFEVIGVLLFIGAMGKSAQLFFHTWLPDAMEGPTPVSALIHAATMVTAGVFLLARMSPLMEFAPVAKGLVVVIGASTCFFAATVGLVQPDIKRTIAYSTCSQLGYMFVAAGFGFYQGAMFHLTTHAFFKALLFLSAGSVIHALHDEQDMFRMGGLARKLPVTCAVMWIGSLALGAIPPFAGWWSKDAIIDGAWMAGGGLGGFAWTLCTAVAFLTALYSWRLLFLVFHGRPRVPELHDHAHESGPVILLPLLVLAVGAAFGGWLLRPWYIGEHQAAFWNGSIFNAPDNHVLATLEHTQGLIALVPTILSFLGVAVAFVCYMLKPEIPAQLARSMRPLYLFLLNKWYFDELYDRLFVRPYRALARLLWHVGDETVIDGVPRGLARLTVGGSSGIVRIQTGSIAVYAFTMLIGLVVLLSTFLLVR